MIVTTFFRLALRTLIDGISLVLPLPRPKGMGSPKLRILILNWRDIRHEYVGGAEVYIHELAKRWVHNGVEVTLFCGNDGKDLRYETIDGVHVIRRGGLYLVYLWAALYYIFRLRNRVDLILDCQNGIPFFTPLYSSKPIVGLLFHIHQEVIFHSLRWPLNELIAFIERDPMKRTYSHIPFLTISNSTKAELRKMGYSSNTITVAHPGVDASMYVPGRKSVTPTILFLGRLKPYKSIAIIIKALKQVITIVPDVKLIIAGDGEDRARLMSEVRKNRLQKYVTFTGQVSEAEKVTLYQQAWVFVNPSLKEGWAMTNIEASACGTAVIASDVSGNRDSVKHEVSGFVVPYGDVDAFSRYICIMLTDTKRRVTMEHNGIDWARKFSWESSARQSLAFLKKTCMMYS